MILKRKKTILVCSINKRRTGNKKCVAESSVHKTLWIKWRTTSSKRWPIDKDSKKKCSPSIITREKWDSGNLKKRGPREWDRSKKKCDNSWRNRLKRKRSASKMKSRTLTIKPKCGRLTRPIGKKKIKDLRVEFKRLTKITRNIWGSKWRTRMRKKNSIEVLCTHRTSWWINHYWEKSTRS